MTAIVAYVSSFVLIVSLISVGYRQPQVEPLANAASEGGIPSTPQILEAPSVDELVATDIAGNLAESTNMPVAPNVASLSISLAAKTELAQASDSAISKPQVVQVSSTDRSVKSYVTKSGETVTQIAAAHNISADTVRWVNNISGDTDALSPGTALSLLPVDGFMYTTKAGDTPESLANTYKADAQRIVSFNDLEVKGVTAGQKIVIPGGVLPTEQRPGYVAPRPVSSGRAAPNGVGVSGYRVGAQASAAVGNKYAYGNCTWYAYNRRAQLGMPVGSFWGNANTWAIYARSAGYVVDRTPTPGAVMVELTGYYGHVSVVESVDPNTGDVTVSEMNNYAYGGFGIVNKRTLSGGQAAGYQFIH